MRSVSFRPWAAAAAAVLSAGLAACGPGSSPRVEVKTTVVGTGAVTRNVEFSGVLVPASTLNLYAKLVGQATAVNGDVGSRVRKGQVLVQIDTKELNAQLKVAQAQAAGVSDQAAQAKIGVDTARLNLEMAQRAYDRTKTLFDTKVVTQSQLDDAQTKLDLARNAFDNANRQYQTVSTSGVEQAQAQINYIKVQISNSTITSPIDGVVTNRNINPGEITTLSTPLMTVADTSTLKLQGNVSQEDVVHLALGEKVTVTVDAMPGKEYSGRIEQVGPIAAATGQYFPVVVRLRNDSGLLAGMTAKASLSISAPAGPVVPLSAVGSGEDGRTFVFVAADGRVRRQLVTLGMKNGSEAQVLSGLRAGDVIAVSNVAALQDGMEVAQ